MAGTTFGFIARKLAEKVAAGTLTQEDAEAALRLEPGERLCANGVISGSAAHPDIPRHGADETDNDHPACDFPNLRGQD
jgi:hypothetical protein